jgi:hypothetical protein
MKFSNLSIACGYEKYFYADSIEKIKSTWAQIGMENDGPIFFEIKINATSRNDLLRPEGSPEENKNRFMKILCSI